jgi:hypothetical protein
MTRLALTEKLEEDRLQQQPLENADVLDQFKVDISLL